MFFQASNLQWKESIKSWPTKKSTRDLRYRLLSLSFSSQLSVGWFQCQLFGLHTRRHMRYIHIFLVCDMLASLWIVFSSNLAHICFKVESATRDVSVPNRTINKMLSHLSQFTPLLISLLWVGSQQPVDRCFIAWHWLLGRYGQFFSTVLFSLDRMSL